MNARLMQGIAMLVAMLLGSSVGAQPAKVRFGLPVQALDGLALFVAEDRGFFTEQGLTPEFTVLKGGTGVVQALVSGDIDIGMVGPVEVSVLRSKGVDVKMIGTSLDWPVFSILVHKQLNITNVSGLKGRSIGVTSPASLTDAMARYFLTRAGLQPGKDVTILSLGGGPEMVGSFKSRRVDALILFEPFVQLLLSEGIATMILDVPKEIPGYPSFGVVAKKNLLDSNLPLARKSMAAIAKGLRFIKSDEKAARAIAQKKFPAMKPEVLNAALDHYLPYFSKDGVISPQVIQFTQELNRSAGLAQTIYSYSEMYFNVR